MSIQPVMITTWKFGVAACRTGWQRMAEGASALDAIEAAANVTELDPLVNSVGYGGRPNADCVVELDAAIMDGPTHAAGAVGSITSIRTPISVARRVMERTPHVMLVGENARRFAIQNGFPEQELLTPDSLQKWQEWKGRAAQSDVAHFDVGPQLASPNGEPHGRSNPDTASNLSDGPSDSLGSNNRLYGSPRNFAEMTPDNHDTIGLCALDSQGNLAVGCTTSGMAWKVPGRVGDSPIIGSGLYVDNEVGGAAGTGHGDEMMKACVSYRVVMLMEQGRAPQEACEETLRYLLRKRPPHLHDGYGAALIAIRKDGLVGAAGTLSGFAAPDRLWQFAVASGPEVTLKDGPYVSLDGVTAHL